MIKKTSVREKPVKTESALKAAGESIISIPRVSVNPAGEESLCDSVETFKDSLLWRGIEQTALIGEDLQTKEDEQTKLDVDSVNGQ